MTPARAGVEQRLCEEATQGPWRALPDDGNFIVNERDEIVAEVDCCKGRKEDLAFIAHFHPQRVKAMLEEISNLRRAAERGREEIRYQASTIPDVNIQARIHSALQLIDYLLEPKPPAGGSRG